MPNIAEWRDRIKTLLDEGLAEWGLYAVMALLILGAFGLGRLSALVSARPLIQISQAQAAASAPALAPGGLLVASRTGAVYYYPWCAGATKIAAANQRWFKSEAEAKAAGYRAAKNCKGLEAR